MEQGDFVFEDGMAKSPRFLLKESSKSVEKKSWNWEHKTRVYS